MYLDHFGLNEPPFRITPHTDFFFAGANRGAMLDALQYALLHDEGIVKVSGEVGSGKTMLCRVLMERLPANVETIYLANPSLARDEILFALADELQLDLGTERHTRVLKALQDALIQRYAQGRRVIVLIDEAHAMPAETLEEIRLLSNLEANRHKLLQIVLFGQPELDEHLSRPHMRQLKERITHGFRLGPLTRQEIAAYVDFRMRAAGYKGPSVFSSGAVRLLAEASEGLTRRVNILADKALLAAFARNTHAVTEREVRRAIDDSEFHQPPPDRGRFRWLAVGLTAGAVIGALGAWSIAREPGSPIASPPKAISPPTQGQAASTDTPVPAQPVTEPASAESATAAISVEKQSIAAEKPTSQPEMPPEGNTRSPADSSGKLTAVRTVPATDTRHGDTQPLPPRGALARTRFERTQEWLATAPGSQYSIQLITVRDRDSARLEDFLLKSSRLVSEENLFVYSVKIDGEQHYRVATGLYPTVADAKAAIRDLPPFLLARTPYHRSVERMRSQNRQ